MAHILNVINSQISVFCVCLCFSLACQEKEVKHYEGEIASLSKKDTVPLVIKEKNVGRRSLQSLFIQTPNEFFDSSLFPTLTQSEKENLFLSSPQMKDVLVDTTQHYIFFDRETKNKNKGILTTFKAFPYSDGAELIVVEVSKWSDENTETEDIRCLKIEKDGTQVEMSRYNVFPEILLQDFFKEDITLKIPAPDHNSMPALLYEIQRNQHVIRVFLGEWKHTKEVFSYKPDIDFVELRWENNHFIKI